MRLVAGVAFLLAATTSAARAQDTFADDRTERLLTRAIARHGEQEARLLGYRARVHTRMEGGVGASRFGPSLRVMAYESVSNMHWERPNDLRVDVVGMRSRSFRIPGLSARSMQAFMTEVFASEPWFAPRSLGEEIQLLGVPDEPALHPLASDGPEYYRYAVTDSVALVLSGRTVRAVAVEVRPKLYGPMLVSGEMWLDADSLDVVRLSVAFVGENLWEDDPDSPTLVELEADLEYALHDGRFWLPLRQILSAAWTYRYMPGAKLTSTAVTTFAEHRVNPDTALAFRTRPFRAQWSADWSCGRPRGFACGDRPKTVADRWENGRWEVNLAPLDSLIAYDFGTAFAVHDDLMDEEVLTQRLTEMAEHSEALPGHWTGHRLFDLDWTEALRVVGFNRVQGPSVTLATALRTGLSFTTLNLAGRVSAADSRVTGSVTWRRAAPRGTLEIAAFREVLGVEPWAPGVTISNSMRALFLGHDDADYYLGTGAGVTYTGHRGGARNFTFRFRLERQRSLARASGSFPHDVFFGDGDFQENPEVREGDFVRVSAERFFSVAPGTVRFGVTTLSGEGRLGARVWGASSLEFPVRGRVVSLRLRSGSVIGDRSPQLDLRLGGPATVRGHTYGVLRGRAIWAAQVEMVLSTNQWAAPVIFGDIGGRFLADDPLAAAGVGASLLKGWMRVDFAKSVTTNAPVRVDVYFRAPR